MREHGTALREPYMLCYRCSLGFATAGGLLCIRLRAAHVAILHRRLVVSSRAVPTLVPSHLQLRNQVLGAMKTSSAADRVVGPTEGPF
jgi:hypothetical protein